MVNDMSLQKYHSFSRDGTQKQMKMHVKNVKSKDNNSMKVIFFSFFFWKPGKKNSSDATVNEKTGIIKSNSLIAIFTFAYKNS